MIRLTREQIARRAAQDIWPGAYVNLGIGLPTQVGDMIPPDREVFLHSENGILHLGPRPPRGEEDPDLINASKEPVSLRAGAAIFDSELSFTMMRGGHLDLALLGAYEVAENGDLANWTRCDPNTPPAVGGAMELAFGAREVWVLMEHHTRDGTPRLLHRCRLPLTARGVVTRIYTDLAVLAVTPQGLQVMELAAGVTHEQLQQVTEAVLLPLDKSHSPKSIA
ncbi:3-oxoadipate CoA-transferase subunit B [Burkholderia pseudomallei MSHR338]|uniref:3-oxoacid CoA-transferase subunit B n=1 Tax=Burkholderia pseudomallei TaxID=28450 RepID=UPI0001A488B1|nr:3-oxoacid CoA-transferase subunit B [Burkholderia pseudomallei]ACQ96872.1 3-oxoadipate CoA-transferase subunit B (Beta-ketoadipate:succinyl-CoA transferase subunit B) [Burkholderia pseudomallei MSHR346]AIP09533.1 3-oxoadipate CoA-transferase subunit B [Burkholderia pseudomallei]EQA90331.1 3-oxoadipate CoA-transferase subunit B [Burkholderia pseudomallei MSHR338]OMW31626.1 3-oxoadipate CoA-transferase [Burkholderia pseudomallei]ONA26222.1 3-oxoadipate CoA-transferase [Burkholderia pseudomall